MNEIFEQRMRKIADDLEALRIEIFQASIGEEKKLTDDELFKLQSDIRGIATEIGYADFDD